MKTSHLLLRSQSGISIIGALVSAAILSISAVILMRVWSNELQARSDSRFRVSVDSVAQDLGAVIWQKSSQYAAANCSGRLSNLVAADIGEFLVASYAASVAVPAGAPQLQADAASRCRRPTVTGNDLHLCIVLAKNPKMTIIGSNSFAASTYAFAEIRVRLVDLPSNQALATCASGAFAQNPAAGGRIDYSIHWSKSIMGNQQFQTKTYSFIAAK